MEPNHLINTLTLELDKELSTTEAGRLKSRILDAIDYCFNKYYPYAKHLKIEDISLDLGTIDSKNFQEEFIVILSYLLPTPLDLRLPPHLLPHPLPNQRSQLHPPPCQPRQEI